MRGRPLVFAVLISLALSVFGIGPACTGRRLARDDQACLHETAGAVPAGGGFFLAYSAPEGTGTRSTLILSACFMACASS